MSTRCVCVCVKWPRYLTVQGVTETKLKQECVHMCLSTFPYNLWAAPGQWCFDRQTALCLLRLSTSLTYKTETNTLCICAVFENTHNRKRYGCARGERKMRSRLWRTPPSCVGRGVRSKGLDKEKGKRSTHQKSPL